MWVRELCGVPRATCLLLGVHQSCHVLSSFSPSDVRREEACSKAVASQRCAASAEPGVIMVWPDESARRPDESARRPDESARRSDGSCVHDTMDGTTATRRRDPPIDPIRGSVDRGFRVDRCAMRAKGDEDTVVLGGADCASPDDQTSPSLLTIAMMHSGSGMSQFREC